jgi:hypothetical protein
LKAAINGRCDDQWRTDHPQRAETSGGHGGDAREQRMADALLDLVTGTGNPSAAGRTAVIVAVQAETLDAEILGTDTPLTPDDIADLVDDPRTDLYAAIQDSTGAILKFGRSRRLASPLQRLALALRERGRCAWDGCNVAWNRCDADHDPPFEPGGATDIDQMRLLCTNEHHPHRHDTGNNITRQPDGTWTVTGEQPISQDSCDSEPTVSSRSQRNWDALLPYRSAEEQREALRILNASVGRILDREPVTAGSP